MAATLQLLIPGLLGPWPADQAIPTPDAPALAWLLARAEVGETQASAAAVLFDRFGLPVPDDRDVPVAAITALADGLEPTTGWWLRADPAHLRPDWQGVFLVDARALAIAPEEAAALATAFNALFADDGLRLQVPHPERWYLRLPDDPGLRTSPLEEAIGRDINPLLPRGPNAARWHTRLTEAQMLFHAHPVNRAREERNQPMINGLWLWGGGFLPAGARAPAAELCASDALTCGLGQLVNALVRPVPESAGTWRDSAPSPDSLVVLDSTRYDRIDGDPLVWVEHVAALEREWFAPCRRWLQTGQISALHLYGGQGRRYALTPAARWRFWRRSRPITE